MNNTYLTTTAILCALVGIWVIRNVDCKHDDEGNTNNVRTTIMAKGSKGLDQVDLRGGKRKRRVPGTVPTVR